jgi:hypothetical protein
MSQTGSSIAALAAVLAGATMHLPGNAPAHDLFTAYVQHRIAVTVGTKHVDVTIQLTFFEDGAEHERKHIDADGDGRLGRSEIESYLKKLESSVEKAVALKTGDLQVRLGALQTPELDLMETDRAGRAHLRLTLFLFGTTPAQLSPGTELVLEDRLWPEARALGSIQAEGKDGCRLEAIPPSDPLFPSAREGEARTFKVRVLAPPVARSKP